MNERIADLYEKASEWALESDSPKSYKDRVMSKFAELIVRECIDVVEDAGGIDKYHYTGAIGKHFGLEE